MGITRQDYVICGWKLPYAMRNKDGTNINWNDDKYLPYILPYIEGRQSNDYSIVVDWNNKNYVIFGYRVAHCSGDMYVGWEFQNIDLSRLDSEEIKAKYREVFEIEDSNSGAEPYLFIFSTFN